jgi:pimeloyl-ACP methyl ester carboxylesterase
MKESRLESLEWGSHRIHIEDEGEGEPVILLHSSGMSGRQWRRLQARLVRDGLRTIVPDLLGSGRSSAWPDGERFTFLHDVEVVESLLQRFGGGAHLVGHSYGGLIALRVAERHPDEARSLSLYDPVAFGVLESDRDAAARANLESLHFRWGDSPAEHEAWLAAFVTYWNGPEAWPLLQGTTRAEFVRTGWVAHEGARSLVADRTPASAYAKLWCPTLLLTGSTTPTAARQVIERLVESIPSARKTTLQGAGHMGPLTHGDLVSDLIARHIATARA